MVVQQVFSSNLNASIANLSSRFVDAIAFYIHTPLSTFELEIDCYLQIYLPSNNQPIIRVISLGKIEEQNFSLNSIDTESIVFIPEEYQDTGIEMALLFVPSDFTTTYLEAFVIKKNANLQTIAERLLAIENFLLNGVNPNLDSSDFNHLHNLGFI